MTPVNSSWVGRRWWEFRVGYTTYLAFTFNFSNFILILYGLTDWFKDIPLHIFGILLFCAIMPFATLIGYKHNRIQLKTEQQQLQHLHPYNNKIVPNSKEVLQVQFTLKMLDWMMQTTQDKALLDELKKLKSAYERFAGGEYATEAMKNEEI